MRLFNAATPLVLATALITGLASCSAPAPAPAEVEQEQTVEETQGPAEGEASAWAKPVTNPGELIATAAGPNFQVDIYQVGTATATKTGQFSNPDTNKPIIEVGAELVFVNYVVTNTSSETIPLSASLVGVQARYDDWPYLQGMDSVVDFALDEELGINRSAIATGSGESPYQWEPGTSFSYGQNFLYQAGSPIGFKVTLTPAKASGDLDHDKRAEVEVKATIK